MKTKVKCLILVLSLTLLVLVVVFIAVNKLRGRPHELSSDTLEPGTPVVVMDDILVLDTDEAVRDMQERIKQGGVIEYTSDKFEESNFSEDLLSALNTSLNAKEYACLLTLITSWADAANIDYTSVSIVDNNFSTSQSERTIQVTDGTYSSIASCIDTGDGLIGYIEEPR